MATLTVPVELGGTGTTYRDDTGTNGMASNNGFGHKTLLLPMLGEIVAVGNTAVDKAAEAAVDRAAVEAIAEDFGDVSAAITGAQTAQAAAETAQGLAETAQAAAETAQGLAETAQAAAETALGSTETARDAALAATRIYANTAAGLAAVASGEYFYVPSGDAQESLILYQDNAGVAVDTGKRMPTVDAVTKPLWAGLKNGWPDPFFRNFDISGTFLGAVRMWKNSSGIAFSSVWAVVANPTFTGNALRNSNVGGASNLCGPMVSLADLGAVEGETITLYVLGRPTGGTLSVPGYFTSATIGSIVGGQKAPLNATGGTSVANGTLGWLRHQHVVPAGVSYFAVAPYVSAGTADIVAVWAFKGASGPAWPTLDDPNSHAYAIDSLESRMDSAETDLGDLGDRMDYAIDSYGEVTAASTTVTLAVTSPSTAARDLTFRGWGEPYVPAGVSFNAVRIKQISRTAALESSKWRTLTIMVRTGAGSHLSTATLVAVGSTTVLEDEDTLTDVTILLKDPVTGAVKTLTDADFSGGEYFIGVYASNAAGAPASCGEPRATQPNHLGSIGYYTTNANPLTASWSAVTGGGGPRQGFEHLLLTSPVEETAYVPTDELAAAIVATMTTPAPELVVPPYVYGVQSRECNVYTDNLFVADPADYLIDYAQSGSLGKQQNERWTWTPAGAVASGTLTVSAYEKRTGSLLTSAVMQLRSAASSAGTGTTKIVQAIGDSLINGGVITQTVLDIAATDAMGVTMIGTRGSGSNKHEGRGGWTISAYTSNYSDGTVGANPFWIGGAVNYPQYLINNALATPDWVFIHLGINDCFSQTTDAGAVTVADSAFDNLDTLIASIKAAGAGVKVALCLPPPPSFFQDAFGDDYGVGQTRWRFKRNILIWARELITRYSGQEASRIYIVPSNTALDTVNNMATTTAAVNSRNATTVARQSDSVHPATSGYQQIGDAWWAFLKCNA